MTATGLAIVLPARAGEARLRPALDELFDALLPYLELHRRAARRRG
jgi:hypothetical protein